MKKWMLVVSMFAAIFLAACGNEDKETVKETAVKEEKVANIQLMENEEVGNYLADSKGMTLYYFKKDEPGKSNCAGDCLANWPPFTQKEFEVPAHFDKEDFETIKREDTEAEQVTYKGYPLYYFAKDKVEGDVNGQGVKDVWFTVNSETEFK
ncbi:COG4315 family predicted lipoprotein [Domibacillus mangrovi]|uniref:Lipoprotein n=1 Tax=Domibacillus mangrovi TaxID=1714354 RepID=A0A1Q5P6Q3_9BACI|nr:hypothetical protein [Domibacillus mangrovi]OKL37821.1 hypothetical protein BLL40_03065 [Domibacillus mangrovi]